MSENIVLGGYLMGVDGVRHPLPVRLNPSNSTTEDTIKSVSAACKGAVVMRCKPHPECGPCELEMYADAGNFLLMLNVNDESDANDLMVLLRQKYPAEALTRDIGLVCAVFNEFAHAGNVSTTPPTALSP